MCVFLKLKLNFLHIDLFVKIRLKILLCQINSELTQNYGFHFTICIQNSFSRFKRHNLLFSFGKWKKMFTIQQTDQIPINIRHSIHTIIGRLTQYKSCHKLKQIHNTQIMCKNIDTNGKKTICVNAGID